MASGSGILRGITISVLFVAVVLAGLLLAGAHERVLQLLVWLDGQGVWALLLFILIMAAVVVLVLPGVLFTTGAGFVFGVVEGTIGVVLGTTLGAMLAFLIARYLFGTTATQYILTRSKLRVVTEELTRRGWKIVLLTRLVPFFPFKLSNYFFGLTQFSLRGFVCGTFVGIIPFSLHNVYLGAITADVATLGTRTAGRTSIEWALYISGFLVTVAAVLYLGRLAHRALAKYTEETREEDRRSCG